MTTLAFIMFDGAGGAAGGWAAGRLYQVRKNTFVNFKLFCFFIGTESDHQQPLSLTDSITNSLTPLLFSTLDWCDPGVRWCQLKTCWGYYCCWCWSWGSCWQHSVTDLGADVWSLRLWAQGLVKILKLKFSKILKLELVQHFVADVL